MANDIIKYWEADRVDVPSATVPKLITTLRGGESITLKTMSGQGQKHYIGSSAQMTTTRSYQLDTGEQMTLTLPVDFGRDNAVEIWALASNAGDDICYIKLIDLYPQTAAGD